MTRGKLEALRACSLAALLVPLMYSTGAMAQEAASTGKQEQPAATPTPNQIAQPLGNEGTAPEATGDGSNDIVVTGSRLRTGFQQPTPVTTVGADEIKSRAPGAIIEVLNQLPEFRNSQSQTVNNAQQGGPAGTNKLDLRGLGTARTLVLLDGRRMVLNDTNVIPTLMVERVDVVTGGASAAYGTDAVAGVVQFTLKKKVHDLQLTAQGGVSEAGDDRTVLIGGVWGHDFGDRVNFTIGGEFHYGSGVGNRLEREWGREEAGLISLPATRAAGLPALLFTSGVRYNSLSAGGLISTPGPLYGITFLPGGQIGHFDFGTLSGSDLMTRSTSNYGLGPNNTQFLKTADTRANVIGRLTVDLNDRLQAWGEMDYEYLRPFNVSGLSYLREDTSAGNGNSGSIIVSVNNPFLPAAVHDMMVANGLTAFTMGRANTEIGPTLAQNVYNTYTWAGGLKGKFANNWTWDFTAQYGQENYVYQLGDEVLSANYNAAIWAVRDASGNIVCGDPATNPNLPASMKGNVTPGCVPFNLFGEGSPSAAAVNYVRSAEIYHQQVDLYDATFNVTGNLFNMPAGPVPIAFGAEGYRNYARQDQSPLSGQFFAGNLKASAGGVNVYEGYLEATVPLLKNAPFAKILDLNGAIRQAQYSAFGGSTTWKVGAIWQPHDWVRFRVTRSHDLRAPTTSDLFGSQVIVPTQFRNPITNAQGTITQISRPNSNLQPEIGDTWTIGAVLTPTIGRLSNLSISADFYSIKITGVISSVGLTNIVLLCDQDHIQQYCDAITRDATNPTGIGSIVNQSFNANRQQVSGLDLELSYKTALTGVGLPGDVSIRALGTYTGKNVIYPAVGASVNNLYTAVPRWRWSAQATYRNSAWSAYLQVYGFSRLEYQNTNVIDPSDPGYSTTSPMSISSNKFPAYAYANFGFTAKVTNKIQIYGNVDNVMNRQPPINAQFSIANLYDLLGRSYRMGVRASF